MKWNPPEDDITVTRKAEFETRKSKIENRKDETGNWKLEIRGVARGGADIAVYVCVPRNSKLENHGRHRRQFLACFI
jgi:hypothetical protein